MGKYALSYGPFPAYTHIIELGANDIEEFFAAVRRYQIGQSLKDQGKLGDGVYEDPVAFDRIFEIVDGSPRLNVEPLITVSCICRQQGF